MRVFIDCADVVIRNDMKVSSDKKSNSSLNDLGKCVCRIRCDSKTFDPAQPYINTNDGFGTGTGFLVEDDNNNFYIFTAHHVISNNVDIGVYFDAISQGERFKVDVLGYNPYLDVAILKLKIDTMEDDQYNIIKNIPKFKIGNSDYIRQGDTITALGYALGAPHLQISAGIISGRIFEPNRLQTDAQINKGNSGGPIVNSNNEVVGLVTSGVMFAHGISYATPFKEIKVLQERILNCSSYPCKDIGFSFNCVFRPISQDSLYLKTFNGKCKSGILVAGAHKNSKTLLKKGDILCSIKEPSGDAFYDIDMHGNIDIKNIWSDTKLNFKVLLDRIEHSSRLSLTVKVYRPSVKDCIILETPVEESMFVYREMFPDTVPVEYFSDGGIVLQMLNEELIMYTSLGSNYIKSPEVEMYSSVIITHLIGGSPFSKSDILKTGQAISSMIDSDGNEIQIESLEDVQKVWKSSLESGVITLCLRNGSLVSATVEEVKSFNESVSDNKKNGLKCNYFP